MSRMNFSGYVGHVTIFCWTLTTVARCRVMVSVRLKVSGWLVVMYTYLYYLPLSLSHCQCGRERGYVCLVSKSLSIHWTTSKKVAR